MSFWSISFDPVSQITSEIWWESSCSAFFAIRVPEARPGPLRNINLFTAMGELALVWKGEIWVSISDQSVTLLIRCAPGVKRCVIWEILPRRAVAIASWDYQWIQLKWFENYSCKSEIYDVFAFSNSDGTVQIKEA